MRRTLVLLLFAVLSCGIFGGAGRALALDSPAGRLVRENAAPGTPHVLDGRVYAIAQVGDTMLLGGTFTRARNDGSTTERPRSRLLAFSATTGQISTTFLPEPNGTVRAILPAGDGTSVYVGGDFTSIGGASRSRLARIRVSDGAVLSTFNAGSITGEVRDLGLRGGRLWLGGAFTHVGGRAQRALTTVNPTTGAASTFMAMPIAGVHNGGVTQVLQFDITPDGSRLVAIGNFDTLSGVQNHQLFMLDLTGTFARASTFHTNFYTSACSSSFESYLRDVDFSPDGSYFVVVTTGAYGGNTSACDTASRFETEASGEVAPSWVDYTGGDTTWSVEVTDAVVYVGGHERWWNNPFAGDRAGQGAVSRKGIAALDPINGLPLSWDPGRELGVGVFDFLYTDEGLWVGSDTDRINGQVKGRIARIARNGEAFPAVRTPRVPNDVYSGGPAQSAGTGIDWNGVRGAFMLNGFVYLARNDGTFSKRTFDGTSYGPRQSVNGADRIVPLTDWQNDIRSATGMFYDSGRIYFTLSGRNQLFYRYFTPQSDLVGAKRLVASGNVTGISFSSVRGMFGTGSRLYWASTDGNLRRIDWQQGAQSGSPVAGTALIASGPAVDGVTWGARAVYLFHDENGNCRDRCPERGSVR